MINKQKYMRYAIKQAEKALDINEVPVGAVIVREGKIIAKAYNRKEKEQIATSHAEILAIQAACKKLGSWRLDDCTIYVTLEPCVMCAGAIVSARIKKVVSGAVDKSGFLSGSEILAHQFANHKVEYESGVLKEECESIIVNFFKNKRK